MTKSVDFDEKVDYFKDSFQVIDTMHGLTAGAKKYIMTVNSVTFNDSLFNPFD